jgi:hypothetical protein
MRRKSARVFLRIRFRSRMRAIAWPASLTPTAARISLRTQLRKETVNIEGAAWIAYRLANRSARMPGLSQNRTPERILVILTKILLLWTTATDVMEAASMCHRRPKRCDEAMARSSGRTV